MNNTKIRLGIIGAGKVTTNPGRHIDSVRSLKDKNVEITAVADIVPGLAAQTAEDFGIPYRTRREPASALTAVPTMWSGLPIS